MSGVLDDMSWNRVEANAQGAPYPWTVYEADADTDSREINSRDYGQYILQFARSQFDNETVETALWCGFPGLITLGNARFDEARRRTCAVTTSELEENSIPNPLTYAFRGGIISAPTVAMLSSQVMVPVDPGFEIIGKRYALGAGITNFDLAVIALFVFRSKSLESGLAQ